MSNARKGQRSVQVFALLQTVMILLLLTGCAPRRPVLIGFAAELSGRNATLGVQARNGAMLAVEMINQNGGINGRPLEMIIRDDEASKEKLLEVDRELIQMGVVALTGHLTSWESVAVRSLIEERKVILFSPTTSSPDFTAQADYFFRLIPANPMQAYPLAEYATQTLQLKKLAVLHDTDNMAFAQTYADAFTDRFQATGGQMTSELHFSSSANPNFKPLLEKIQQDQPDVLLVVASSMDTALIAQHMRLMAFDVPILASNWSYTDDLIKNGGQAVEGILISSHFYAGCQDPDFLAFKQHYQETYGQPPAFVAVLTYETVQVLGHALQKTGGSASGLAKELTQVRDFKGLCDRISLDAFGDAYRSLFLVTVQDGSFQLLETIPYRPLP